MAVPAVWLQALITVGAALVVSSVSLLYRYRQKGHPFGSSTAAMWAVFVIMVTAAPAGVALLLPRVPPAYLGVAIPAVLVVRGDRLHERRKPTEDANWYRVATLGVRLLLDRLEQQMDTDRDGWVKSYVDALSTMELAEHFAENLYSTLAGRSSMRPYLSRLRSHRDAVLEATERARAIGHQAAAGGRRLEGDRDYRRAVHDAKRALIAMLQLAHDHGHQSAADLSLRLPTGALTA